MSGAAHGQEVVAEVETALHRLAPECKVAALLVFVLAVALVPHGMVWPYAVDAALLAVVVVWSRTPPRALATRLLVEIPFVAFVVVLPFVADGPQTAVLGLDLSVDGLWTAWGIVAKATLAVLATGVLAATTPAPAILSGAERLRVPAVFTTIAAFAIRYLQVVLDELRRMQLARVARGDDPRWLWQAKAVAQSSGALAVRCFSRGERVHGAMLARGFDGHLPDLSLAAPARAAAWTAALLAPVVAAAVTVAAHGWPA
jgi:cobalt/nickel transport system permease protein